MKRMMILILAAASLLTAGCSGRAAQPKETPTMETTFAETTMPVVPETTTPETQPMPQLCKGIIQADHVPAVLTLLSRGDMVEVVEYQDKDHAVVNTSQGTGIVETQLLRFAGEEDYKTWTGYARYNAELYNSYQLVGAPVCILKTNAEIQVLDELENCYVVTVADEAGFIAKQQVNRYRIQTGSGGNDNSGGSGGSTGNGGGSTGQDGGDISLFYNVEIRLLSTVTKTASAQVRADRTPVVLTTFHRGDTVNIIAEDGFVPACEGYYPIFLDESYAYVPQNVVWREEEEPFAQWEGFADYNCQMYDNYLLQGKPVKHINGNTPVTVLWDAGICSVVSIDGAVGYVNGETIRTTRIPPRNNSDNSGGAGGSGSGSSSSGEEWTPPAL